MHKNYLLKTCITSGEIDKLVYGLTEMHIFYGTKIYLYSMRLFSIFFTKNLQSPFDWAIISNLYNNYHRAEYFP